MIFQSALLNAVRTFCDALAFGIIETLYLAAFDVWLANKSHYRNAFIRLPIINVSKRSVIRDFGARTPQVRFSVLNQRIHIEPLLVAPTFVAFVLLCLEGRVATDEGQHVIWWHGDFGYINGFYNP